MSIEKMKQYFNKLFFLLSALRPVSKVILFSFCLFLPIVLILIMNPTSSSYVILYSSDQMKGMDLPKIKEILDSLKVSYKVNENNLLLVPVQEEQRLRMDLALYGFPKAKQDKGYELFDSTTWIKGEKELQILELRALKGQLEKDLSQFDNVRSANVILDVPQTKSFGGKPLAAKASVILDLVPGARLSQNQLRAMTNHLSSAIRGLSPNMVAISDTTGKLYQGLDYEGTQDLIRNAEIAAEEHIKAKIDSMLATIVGPNHFYTTVQVTMNRNNSIEERKIYSGTVNGVSLGNSVVSSIKKSNDQQTNTLNDLINSNLITHPKPLESSDQAESEQLQVPTDYVKITTHPGKIEGLSIGILVDENIWSLGDESHSASIAKHNPNDLKKDIENQIEVVLKGYNVPIYQSVDFVPFYKNISTESLPMVPIVIPNSNIPILLLTLLIILGAIVIGLLYKLKTQAWKFSNLNGGQNKKTEINLEDMLEAKQARMWQSSSSFNEPNLETTKNDDSFRKKMNLKTMLSNADARDLAEVLTTETSETVALLFCHLDEIRTAEVFSKLPLKKQIDVLLMLADLDQLDSSSLTSLIQQSKEIFDSEIFKSSYVPKIANITASILKHLSKSTQIPLLNELEQKKPEFTTKIYNTLFIFDEIEPLTDDEIKTIIENISPIDVALALYEVKDELKAKWLQFFSTDLIQKINAQILLQEPLTPYIIRAAQKDLFYYLRQQHKGISV